MTGRHGALFAAAKGMIADAIANSQRTRAVDAALAPSRQHCVDLRQGLEILCVISGCSGSKAKYLAYSSFLLIKTYSGYIGGIKLVEHDRGLFPPVLLVCFVVVFPPSSTSLPSSVFATSLHEHADM